MVVRQKDGEYECDHMISNPRCVTVSFERTQRKITVGAKRIEKKKRFWNHHHGLARQQVFVEFIASTTRMSGETYDGMDGVWNVEEEEESSSFEDTFPFKGHEEDTDAKRDRKITDRLLERRGYEFVRRLGEGTYGVVNLVKHIRSKEFRTAKLVLGTPKTRKRKSANESHRLRKSMEIIREARVMKTYRHPNIVSFFETFCDQHVTVIVMEYCDSGDLAQYLNAARERKDYLRKEKVMKWLVQIALALDFLHESNVLHRDVKPGNILLTDHERIAKLGDLGNTRSLEHTMEMANTACGTPYYMSPELARGESYDSKSDVWSLGCVLYEMLSLKRPFPAKGLAELILKIASADPPDEIPFQVARPNGPVCHLVHAMLRKNPKDRIDVRGVLQSIAATDAMRDFLQEHRDASSSSCADRVSQMLRRKLSGGLHRSDTRDVESKRHDTSSTETRSSQSARPVVDDIPKEVVDATSGIMFGDDSRPVRIGRVFCIQRCESPVELFGRFVVSWLGLSWDKWNANSFRFEGHVENDRVDAQWIGRDERSGEGYVVCVKSMANTSSSSWFPIKRMLATIRATLAESSEMCSEEKGLWLPSSTHEHRRSGVMIALPLITSCEGPFLKIRNRDVPIKLLRCLDASKDVHEDARHNRVRQKRVARHVPTTSALPPRPVRSDKDRFTNNNSKQRSERRDRHRERRRRRDRRRSESIDGAADDARSTSSKRDQQQSDDEQKMRSLKKTRLPDLFLSPIVTVSRRKIPTERRRSGTSAPSPTHASFRRRMSLPKLSHRPWSAPCENSPMHRRPPSARSIRSEPADGTRSGGKSRRRQSAFASGARYHTSDDARSVRSHGQRSHRRGKGRSRRKHRSPSTRSENGSRQIRTVSIGSSCSEKNRSSSTDSFTSQDDVKSSSASIERKTRSISECSVGSTGTVVRKARTISECSVGSCSPSPTLGLSLSKLRSNTRFSPSPSLFSRKHPSLDRVALRRVRSNSSHSESTACGSPSDGESSSPTLELSLSQLRHRSPSREKVGQNITRVRPIARSSSTLMTPSPGFIMRKAVTTVGDLKWHTRGPQVKRLPPMPCVDNT